MKPEELGIGNYYNSTKFGIPVKCEMADFVEIYERAEGATPDETHIAEIFEPIPLTEGWLIKFGLEGNEDDMSIILPQGNASELHIEREIYGSRYNVLFTRGGVKDCDFVYGGAISHTHQLQNLYFALTGKELKAIKS